MVGRYEKFGKKKREYIPVLPEYGMQRANQMTFINPGRNFPCFMRKRGKKYCQRRRLGAMIHRYLTGKRRLTHMESVHRARCMMMEGMRMASMRMMRRAQNTGSFGLRFVC